LSSKPLAINVGALVGHSALRLAVMGEAAIGGKATDVQVEEMKILLKEALTAGAFGFSSTTYMGHRDAAGDHIPSFWAQPDEIVALASVLKDSKAPALGFNPTVGAFGTEHFDLMTRMSIAAARPLNWNLLNVDSKRPEIVSNQMSASDYARERGGRVVALTMPAPTPLRRSYLGGGFGLDALPGGWHEIWAKPPEERVRDLSDPNIRKRLAAGAAQKGADPLGHRTNWGSLTVADGYAPEVQKYRGRLISDIAKESGRTPLDVLFDILVADKMRTSFTGPRPGDDEDSWGLRPEVWRKKDVVLGGADAGAHLDVMCGASYTTRMLSEAIRKRKLIALEEAVHLLTDVPARLYDLKDRGLIEQNRFADLVVFDPNTVGPTDDVVRTDMPAAQERIYCGSTGIHAVFVNGSQVVDQGEHTQAHSGKLLRPTEDCAGRIALH
jgi:N-acyl-D-aspartate/D-glutamate deacylase